MSIENMTFNELLDWQDDSRHNKLFTKEDNGKIKKELLFRYNKQQDIIKVMANNLLDSYREKGFMGTVEDIIKDFTK